jgi:hypothetical protein
MFLLLLLVVWWLQTMMFLLLMLLGNPTVLICDIFLFVLLVNLVAISCDVPFACDFCHIPFAFAFI